MPGNSAYYELNAPAQLQKLPSKTQVAIEYLRANVLAGCIGTSKAHVYNNVNSQIHYWTVVPSLHLKLYYYQNYAKGQEIVVTDIEILPANHNGQP